MPIARISVPHRLSIEKVMALTNAVNDGLVADCNVNGNDGFQLITRFAHDAMIIDPKFLHFARTPDASIVETSFLHGGTDSQKRNLYKQIAQKASLSGFVPDDIITVLNKKSPIDCSFGRGETVKETS